MREFQLAVRFDGSASRSKPKLENSIGCVSVGASKDGSVTVALLGVTNIESHAAQLADHAKLHGTKSLQETHSNLAAALLVLESETSKVTVLMPRVGIRQVYWTCRGATLALATSPRRLVTEALPGSINADAIFQYVYFHLIPGPTTVFRDVEKLPAGHQLVWEGRQVELARYWEPAFDDTGLKSVSAAADELQRTLRNAVERALTSTRAAGAFLSGGLDSSTIAGLAGQIVPGIPAISMGFDAEGYDEMGYARTAARRFDVRHVEYYVTPEDVLASLPAIAAAFPEPFGNSSAAAVYQCARIACEEGVDVMLAGDGGDELFGGNERYGMQLMFERYLAAPRLLRKDLLEPVVNACGSLEPALLFAKARGFVRQANVPLPDRLQTYNFLHMHEASRVFTSGLLEAVDTESPLRLLREEYAVPKSASAVNRMLFMDWKFTLHDNDLVKVNAMCDLAGVDVTYPMLDRAVIDFSLRVPSGWKIRGRSLRWFYKRAMRGFLPRKILAKSKHGFGLPFGLWCRTHDGLTALAEDTLSSLSTRGFIRPEFLKEAQRLHRERHAAYYGELVWIFMLLELWFREHVPDARL